VASWDDFLTGIGQTIAAIWNYAVICSSDKGCPSEKVTAYKRSALTAHAAEPWVPEWP